MNNISGATFRPVGYGNSIGTNLVAQTSDTVIKDIITKDGTKVTRYSLNPPIQVGSFTKAYEAEVITTRDCYIMNTYLDNGNTLSCMVTKDGKVILNDVGNGCTHYEITMGRVANRIMAKDPAKQALLVDISLALHNKKAVQNQAGKQVALRRVFMPQGESEAIIKYSIISPEGKVKNAAIYPKGNGILLEMQTNDPSKIYTCSAELNYSDYQVINPPKGYVTPSLGEMPPYYVDLTQEDKNKMKEILQLMINAEKNPEHRKKIEAIIRAL